jgi:hypothetical protein
MQKNHIFWFILISVLLSLESCNWLLKPDAGKSNEQVTPENRILFLNFSIAQDKSRDEYKIELISKIVTVGSFKDPGGTTFNPQKNDLVYTVLDGNSNIIHTDHLKNPLKRSVEYETENRQLERKEVMLDSTEFSIRIQLAPVARSVVIARLSGNDNNSEQLITIPVP